MDQINKISEEVQKRFASYDWPGNIRELENIIERAFAVSIGEEDLKRVRAYIESQSDKHKPKSYNQIFQDFISRYGFDIKG